MCISMKDILKDLDESGEEYKVNEDGQIVQYKSK